MFKAESFKYSYDASESYMVLRNTISNWLWSRFTRKGRIISLLMRKYSVKEISRDVKEISRDMHYAHRRIVTSIKLYTDYGEVSIRQNVPKPFGLPFYDYGKIGIKFIPCYSDRMVELLGDDSFTILEFMDSFSKGILRRFDVLHKRCDTSAMENFVKQTILSDVD